MSPKRQMNNNMIHTFLCILILIVLWIILSLLIHIIKQQEVHNYNIESIGQILQIDLQ